MQLIKITQRVTPEVMDKFLEMRMRGESDTVIRKSLKLTQACVTYWNTRLKKLGIELPPRKVGRPKVITLESLKQKDDTRINTQEGEQA